MKYTEALKQILFNPHSIFMQPPSWGYISHNFSHGIRWIWRAIANILQYPFWIVVRIVFYLTAPLSAFAIMWATNAHDKEVERQRKEILDGYLKNNRKLEDTEE